MGTLTNCVTEGKKERGLFGEENPKNLSSAALAGNIKHLYGYNDQLHVNNKHCADVPSLVILVPVQIFEGIHLI